MTPSNPSPASSNEPEAAEVSERWPRSDADLREAKKYFDHHKRNELHGGVLTTASRAIDELLRLRCRPVAEDASKLIADMERQMCRACLPADEYKCGPCSLYARAIELLRTRPVSAGEDHLLREAHDMIDGQIRRCSDYSMNMRATRLLARLAARLREGAK
jgi:hypothetical protein